MFDTEKIPDLKKPAMTFVADIHTLIFMNTLAIFSMALCLMLVTRGEGHHGPLFWGWALLSAFAGFVLVGQRNQIPDFVSIVLANGFLATSLTLISFAFSALQQPIKITLWRWWSPILVLVLGLLLTGQRPAQITLVNMVYCAQLSLLVGQLYLTPELSYSRGRQLLLSVFGFLALVFILRVVSLALGKVSNLDSAAPSSVQTLTHTATFCVAIIGSFSYLYTLLEIKQREAEALASTDSLTGLPNRRAFMEWSDSALAILKRERGSLALLAIDLDHFKTINDQYGHAEGDVALKLVAHILQRQVREQDFVARMGGEEFVVGLPNTDLQGAMHLAEKLRMAIEFSHFAPNGTNHTLSASIGVYASSMATDDKTLNKIEHFMKRADLLLYEAKAAGRNCIRGATAS